MRETTKDSVQKPDGRRVALCLAAAVICVTMVCGQCWAHDVIEVYDFYVKAKASDQNDTEADVCKCGYWVFVEWWAKTSHGNFDIEIWQPGEPDGPENNDFYPPSGTKIAETSHSTSGSNMGHILFEVTDSSALTTGEHTIRAWVIETSTSPPNAWVYSDDECTPHVVEVSSVDVNQTWGCCEKITFYANMLGPTPHCVEWERQYRADSNASWPETWDSVDDDDGDNETVLNTGTVGQYRYRARNGDDASCATWSDPEVYNSCPDYPGMPFSIAVPSKKCTLNFWGNCPNVTTKLIADGCNNKLKITCDDSSGSCKYQYWYQPSGGSSWTEIGRCIWTNGENSFTYWKSGGRFVKAMHITLNPENNPGGEGCDNFYCFKVRKYDCVNETEIGTWWRRVTTKTDWDNECWFDETTGEICPGH